jgi:hypothetical protein
MEVFSYFLIAENYLSTIRLDLIKNHVSFEQAAETFMQNRSLDLSICHENNLHALVRAFFRTRYFFALKEINKDEQ